MDNKLRGAARRKDLGLNKRLPAYLSRDVTAVKKGILKPSSSHFDIPDSKDGLQQWTVNMNMTDHQMSRSLKTSTGEEFNLEIVRLKNKFAPNIGYRFKSKHRESESENSLSLTTDRPSLKQTIYRLASYLSEKHGEELSDNEINRALARWGLDTEETEENRELVKCHVDALNQRRKMLTMVRQTEKRKKFVCYICGRNFALYAHLRNHLETHSGRKPFSCPDCNKAFATQSGLKRHVPKHSISRDFICDVCHKRYANQSYLKVHMRIHLDQKPYVCPICQRGFRQRAHLNHHLLTHSGEKPHLCEHCGQRFRQANTLEDHLLLHTGERPHQCPHCHLQFTHRVSLKLHMRTHQGGLIPQQLRGEVVLDI